MREDGKINKRAKELGLLYARNILNMDDEVKQLHRGSGFFQHFTDGMKTVLKAVPAAVAVAGAATGQPEVVVPALALHKAINGSGVSTKSKLQEFIKYYKRSGGCPCDDDDEKKGKGKKKKPRKKRVATNKMKRRNALVKKIMKEQGLKMIQASKYIKDNNLTY